MEYCDHPDILADSLDTIYVLRLAELVPLDLRNYLTDPIPENSSSS